MITLIIYEYGYFKECRFWEDFYAPYSGEGACALPSQMLPECVFDWNHYFNKRLELDGRADEIPLIEQEAKLLRESQLD
jgi:hypothetical protein